MVTEARTSLEPWDPIAMTAKRRMGTGGGNDEDEKAMTARFCEPLELARSLHSMAITDADTKSRLNRASKV